MTEWMSGSENEEEEGVVVKRILKLKFDINYDAVREVTVCQHKTSAPCPEKPLGRTLFLSNVPPWATEGGLKRIFATNGPVQRVYVSRKASSQLSSEYVDCQNSSKYLWPISQDAVGRGFKTAYIVFERSSSLRSAMADMDLSQPFILSTEEDPIDTGVRKWKREYNEGILADEEKARLKTEIEEFVAMVDLKKQEAADKAQRKAEPDNNGWITVSRKSGKKSTIGAGKSEKVKARIKAKEAKKRKNKELMNFYKLQVKETKLQKLKELKDKFEVDKQKQRKMADNRKFKPA